MVLCDIGNSNYSFYENGKMWKVAIGKEIELSKDRNIYFISVNDKASEVLKKDYNMIDVAPMVKFDSEYVGLGIDRAVACHAIKDGIIVDAGSAITVDIMQNHIHLGGYILPGLSNYTDIYARISPKLKHAINFNLDTTILPQKTADAISYGIIVSIVTIIKKTAKNKPLYFTGGDGAYLSRFFDGSIVDNSLIFKGMLKILKGK